MFHRVRPAPGFAQGPGIGWSAVPKVLETGLQVAVAPPKDSRAIADGVFLMSVAKLAAGSRGA